MFAKRSAGGRRYSLEFCKKTAKLVADSGESVHKIAKDLASAAKRYVGGFGKAKLMPMSVKNSRGYAERIAFFERSTKSLKKPRPSSPRRTSKRLGSV